MNASDYALLADAHAACGIAVEWCELAVALLRPYVETDAAVREFVARFDAAAVDPPKEQP